MKQLIIISLTAFLLGCNSTKQTSTATLDSRCFQVPDAGMCRAAKPRYYYDPTEKKCKQFIWGGCQGVVPFITLDECKKACGCDSIEQRQRNKE